MRVSGVDMDVQRGWERINLRGPAAEERVNSRGFVAISRADDEPEKEITREALQEALRRINQGVSVLEKRLHFTLDERTERVVVQVIDRESNEVIKQIPPQELLDVLARIRQVVGMLFDEWL